MPMARSDGHRIHYEAFGSGPVLVLHPGTYQVGSHWTGRGYTAALRAGVLAVLDDLGADEASFWGYSMGTWVGYGMVRHAPERATALVAGARGPGSSPPPPDRRSPTGAR